jgi:hypothetical protein
MLQKNSEDLENSEIPPKPPVSEVPSKPKKDMFAELQKESSPLFLFSNLVKYSLSWV